MIRQIERKDIAECVDVIKTSFMTVAQEFNITPENAPRYVAFSTNEEKLLAQYDNEHRPMQAFYDENNKIVGYCSIALHDNGECELNNLVVLPSCRHQGIGDQLLSYSFNKAKELGFSVMKIGIVEENTVLRKWYEAHGFVHTGTAVVDFFPFTCGFMEKKL